MATRELSALQVKRLKHPGAGRRNAMFAVGGAVGLYLQITPVGSRSWVLRFTVAGRRRDMGLGSYPDVSLAQARERARAARDQAWHGVDPIEDRKAVRAELAASRARNLTFVQAFEKYADAKLSGLATEKDRNRWRASIQTHALPHIGGLRVDGLTAQDVLRVMEPLWLTKTETARRVRARIEAILSWSTVAGYRTGDNPARWAGNLDHLLPRAAAGRKDNQPAISLDQAADWFAALRKRPGMGAQALAFTALCAARSGEVRGATWDEIDLDARVWTISAVRMKAAREHRVPLTSAARKIIEAMPRRADSPFVFAAARGGQLSDMTLSKVMRSMQAEVETAAQEAGLDPDGAGWRDPRSGRPAVPHGIRSTFRDWVAERTDYPRDMAEIALAHQVGSEVERAYRRGDMIEKRRAMMQAWAKFLGAHD